MIIKTGQLDQLIIYIMFALLPVDMITGIMLKSNILLPISVSQFYKLFLISFIFFRFIFSIKLLITSLVVTLLLLIPSLYQWVFFQSETAIFSDLVKLSKYLTPVYCFLFFSEYLKQSTLSREQLILKLINFSYWVLIINVLVKHIGLGYPAYSYGDIGTKGFFFAGNEISALLIILSAIIAFNLWRMEKKRSFYFFLILNLLAGLTISSKTAILGIILVFFAIPFLNRSFKVKKLILLIGSSIVLLPIVFFAAWKFIVNSPLILRLEFFYQKFDFWTFILSTRNVYFKNSLEIYEREYSFFEKLIGVGQTKYESLNANKIVEIDIADIFFTYGVLGLFVFLLMIVFVMVQAKYFSKSGNHPYSRFVSMMVPLLFIISTVAGHVFGSGMSAVYLGALFSLMHINKLGHS